MIAALAPLLLAAAQSDPQIEVLASNVPNWPQSEVPGYPGVTFRQYRFLDLSVAANGRWILEADTNGSPYGVLYLDSGVVLLDEIMMAPWAATEQVISFGEHSIDSNGQVVAAVKTRESGVTYPYLVRFNGNSWTVEAEPGDLVPGLNGGSFGQTFTNPIAIENGTTGVTNAALGGFSSGFDRMAWADGVVLAQTGFDAPTGQLGGTTTPWYAFSIIDGLSMSGDGQHHLLWGTLGSGHPDVVAYDGAVVAQEGYPVPGTGMTANVSQIFFTGITPDDSWWASGINSSGNENWVARDGALVAKSGLPLVSGDSRVWSSQSGSRFRFAESNGNTFYIGGQTDGSFGAEDVITLNDTQVLLSKFDQIDLDGNGLYDDNVEFRGIGNGAGVDHLGRLIAIVQVRDGNTGQYGDAVVRITPGNVRLELSDFIAGQNATATIRGAIPGQNAHLAYSLNGAGPTSLPTPYGEVLLSLSPPWADLPILTVDAQGQAQWSQVLPPSLAGVSIWIQGGVSDVSSLRLTRGLSRTIQ